MFPNHVEVHVVNWTWVLAAWAVPYSILAYGTVRIFLRILDRYIGTKVTLLK